MGFHRERAIYGLKYRYLYIVPYTTLSYTLRENPKRPEGFIPSKRDMEVSSVKKLTNKDHQIMAILIDKPRATLTQMSKDLKMPISTVYLRIKQIETRYAFKGFFVEKSAEVQQ